MAEYQRLCRMCGGARWKTCKHCSGTGLAQYTDICCTCGGNRVIYADAPKAPKRPRTPALPEPAPQLPLLIV